MSTPKTHNPDVEKAKSNAGRLNNSRRRPVNGGEKEKKKQEGDRPESGDRSRPKRPADIPVPPELIGTECTGKIFDIIKRFASYGFILINSETSPKNQKPKIYFNMKDYEEVDFVARKGYLVKFNVTKDDKDRLCATNILLTTEGKAAAVLREERIAKYREDEAAGIASGEIIKREDDGGEKKKRGPRPRREPNETAIPLTVTCDGKAEKMTVEAKIFQSIGRLKHSCIEAFGVTPNYSIYCQRTPANPEGVLLTKVILKQMTDGDNIHLGPLVSLPAADDA